MTNEEKNVDVLGEKYSIIVKKYDEDDTFSQEDVSGYCSLICKKIVLCDMATFKGWEKEPKEVVDGQMRKTLRHEIVHAFLEESGLSTNSESNVGAWARNEEIVDWIAIQGPKIYRGWQEADAL